MVRKILIASFLTIFTLNLVEASVPKNVTSAELDLQLHRLINAIHPYRNDVQSSWTRRTVSVLDDSEGPLSCGLCDAVVPILRYWANRYPKETIQNMVIQACKSLSLAPKPDICDPIIKAYTDQFLYILTNTANPDDPNDKSQICGIVASNCEHAALTNITVNVDGNKPAITDREILSATASKTTKIIQFTDLHVDLHYRVDYLNDCGPGMPICCRDWHYGGFQENETMRAGKFGEFRCALPLNTYKLMLDHAKENYPDVRYVFLTGDYIHSGVWLYNKTENRMHVQQVTRAMARAFPDKNVKIYPLTGNHEPHLINMYPPKEQWDNEDYSIEWLYKTVMEPFIERDPEILPKEQLDNFYENGTYTVSPEEGLRLIILNTNLCYSQNFWLAYSPYPVVTKQLQWLADELDKAEKKEENVLIVGHVEPGNCWPAWSEKFNQIVERYEGIIRGSFFGHSHKPQYRVSMAKSETRPVFASYIAGSALPDSMHPTYSVFHADGERGAKDSRWDIVRHETTILHLQESNKAGEAVFYKLADSYETFGMENLSPKSVLDFGNRLMCNQELLDKYLTFHTKGNDTLDHKPCNVNNAACMYDVLCNFVSSNAADTRGCHDFQRRFKDIKCYDSGSLAVSSGLTLVISLALLSFKLI